MSGFGSESAYLFAGIFKFGYDAIYMRRYILEVVVFISGAAVMILEIVASRILAPHIGTSIIVWTSLIGVILASLSLGYFWGGKVADRTPKYFLLRNLLFAAAAYIFFIGLRNKEILGIVSTNIEDIRIASVVSALALFSLPTVFLGMVSPFSVHLKLHNLAKSGRVAGTLYAISTIGSIFGTFWCGFYLLAQIGSRNILILVSLLLILCALFINILAEKGRSLWLLILVLAMAGVILFPKYAEEDSAVLADLDTSYSRVVIRTWREELTGREMIGLSKGRFLESVGYKDGVGMPGYYNYYDLAFHFNPEIYKVLMIGGGGYIYPKYYLDKYPGKGMDVVEIDPVMTSLAEKYFGLKPVPQLRIYHQDARAYIDRTSEKYGAVLIDAFDSDLTIPFQLTSLEAVERYYGITGAEGMVIVNIVGQIQGEPGRFLRAEYETFKSVFPYVQLYPNRKDELSRLQNVILVASKKELPETTSSETRVQDLVSHLYTGDIEKGEILLTDDFAPVEQMFIRRGNWRY